MNKIMLILFIISFFFCSCLLSGQTESITTSKEKDLTLMIYMAADNDLEKYALANLKAMERASYEGINVIVLLDRAEGYDETEGNWTDTRLFEVVHDSSIDNAIKSKQINCPQLGLSVSEQTELDMANPSVLRNFIDFCKASYKAKKYALIIWGHGAGWRGATVDDRSDTYMSLQQLGQALDEQNLCVIGFDTCFGGVLENIYELKDSSDYIVACPGLTPGGGWNYSKLLESIQADKMTTQELAIYMAKSSSGITSVYESQKINDFFISFEEFSQQLAKKIIDSSSQRDILNNLSNCKSYFYSQNPCDIYIDINSMAELYVSDSDSEMVHAAQNLEKQINKLCVFCDIGGAVGIHFIPKTASGAMAAVHGIEYVKNNNNTSECTFVKESQWWVPTKNGDSGSLLDKLFYTSF